MPAGPSAPAVVAALEQLYIARPTFSASAVSAPFGTSPEPSLAFDRCRTPFGVKGNLWRKCVFRPGAFLGGDGFQRTEALEARADALLLLVGELDKRQAMPTDVVPEQVQRRLDSHRVDADLQDVVGGRELLVDPAGALHVALLEARDLLLHRGPTMCVWTQTPPTPPTSRNGR